MNIKYRFDGINEEIPLTTDKPQGKSVAVRHNGTVYYAPLVSVSDPNASNVRINVEGKEYSIPMTQRYRLYYADGSGETVPVANGAIDLADYSDVTKVFSNNGGTIIGGATAVTIGGKNVSLVGGAGNDRLIGEAGDNVLTGGAGGDVFVHTGGKTTITDYSTAQRDKVSLANCEINDISGVTVGAERGVTLTTAENYTVGNGEYSVIANAGGTIVGGENDETIGGNGVSVSGGGGTDVFIYNGGDMRIADYAPGEKVSLMSGYTVKENAREGDNFKLTVINGTNTGTITFENVSSLNSVKVNVNGSDKTIAVPISYTEPMIFNKEPASATKVTLTATQSDIADFSVIGTESIVGGDVSTKGAEYFTALEIIIAAKENATIVGNAKANTITLQGGDSNIITGGIGKDTFIFKSGGGIITDFGIGTTKNGNNKVLATTTKRTGTSTYVEFNRDAPTSYAQGSDVLKVDGKVVEIAFKQDDTTNKENTFTAYITYLNSKNTYSTIALANIAKQATTTKKNDISLAVYVTNLEQMQGSYTKADGTTATCNYPEIYDTGTGTLAQLKGTALTDLFVDKSNSAHSSAIARLDAIIQSLGITTYSADGKVASVSNGIVNAYSAQQGG